MKAAIGERPGLPTAAVSMIAALGLPKAAGGLHPLSHVAEAEKPKGVDTRAEVGALTVTGSVTLDVATKEGEIDRKVAAIVAIGIVRGVEMPAAAEIGIEGATVTGKEAAGMGIETGSEMGGGAGKGVGREIVLVGRAALAEAVAVGGGSCFTFFDYFSQFILGRVFFVAHVLDGNKQQETRM